MKKCFFSSIVVVLSILMISSAPSLGGQIVTQSDRRWAQDIIKNEKNISSQTGKNTVAVLYFNNLTLNRDMDPFKKGITIMLITDLSKITRLSVLERTRIQALIDEMNLAASGIMEKDTIPETGKLLGASFLVNGDFLKGNETPLKIDSDIFNVKKSSIDKTVFSEGDYHELIKLEKDLALKIIEFLNIKLTQKEKEDLKKPLSENMQALGYFFKGIDLSDKGKYQKAKRYYERAVELDPELKMAQNAIDELANLKLIPEIPPSEKILRTTRERASTTNTLGFDQRYHRSVSGPGQAAEMTDVHVKW